MERNPSDDQQPGTSRQDIEQPSNAEHQIVNPEIADKENGNRLKLQGSYEAAGLKDNLHGADYQLKFLMLFAYLGRENQIPYSLSTEVKDATKFDDLIFYYQDKDSKKWKYRLIQIKHTQDLNDEKKRITANKLFGFISKTDFDLSKYFKSYLKDKDKFKDGEIGDMILCTNQSVAAEARYKLSLKQLDKKEMEKNYSFFSKLGGELMKFDSDEIKSGRLIEEFKKAFQKNKTNAEANKKKAEENKNKAAEKKYNNAIAEYEYLIKNIDKLGEFLDKLVLAVNQPSSEKLSEIIKQLMGSETYNVITYAVYKDFMNKWLQHREADRTASFMNVEKLDALFETLKNNIANVEVNGIIPFLYENKITKIIDLKFKDKHNEKESDIKCIHSFLNPNDKSNRILKLFYKEKDSYLSIARVCQALKEEPENNRPTQYIVSNLGLLSSINVDSSGSVVNAFKTEKKHLLVLECSSINEDGEPLITQFYEEVLTKPDYENKKVIFVLNESVSNELEEILKNLPKIPTTDVYMKNTFDRLTSESQNKILTTKVTFNGEEKELRRLISIDSIIEQSNPNLVINEDALISLIIEDNIIGSHPKYEFDTFIHIPHTFNYHQTIDEKCLGKDDIEDIFAINGIDESYLRRIVPLNAKIRNFNNYDNDTQGTTRFIILSDSDTQEEFNQLCSDFNFTIHWLEKKTGCDNMQHKQSRGSLFNLRKFAIEPETLKMGNPKMKMDSVVVIAGDPGIGKSAILTTYSLNHSPLVIHQKESCSWPIRVNLKDHQLDIEKANFNDVEGIIEFLSAIDLVGLKTALAKGLFKYCLRHQGEVILLLDGYDEIKDSHQEKVIELIKAFKFTKGKVWLTTRLNEQHKIEDALGIFSYSINPFDEDVQRKFLEQFWITKLKKSNHREKINQFADNLLRHFHKLDLMKKESVLGIGIVLQARMLAEIFQRECETYVIKNIESENFYPFNFGIIDIHDLYKKFTEDQYKRYLTEKKKITDGFGKSLQAAINNLFTKEHGKLALKTLFPDSDQILKEGEDQKLQQDELCGIGLIKEFRGKTADFIHPTYSEYFVSYLLVTILGKGKEHPKYMLVQEFLLRNIFLDRNKVIRVFIEHKIEKEHDGLKDKWKEITDCDLLAEIETKEKLQLVNLNEDIDTRERLNDSVYEERVNKSKEKVESKMNWQYGETYYYDYKSLYLIKELFRNFLEVRNIELLKTILDFMIKAYGRSRLVRADMEFESNISDAIEHYVIQAKLQSQLDLEFIGSWLRSKIYDFKTFEQNLTRLNFSDQRETDMKTFFSLPILISKYPNTHMLPVLYIELFYPDILLDIKNNIDKFYSDKTYHWLERDGITIAKHLRILTPEMSRTFCSILDKPINDCYVTGYDKIYAKIILSELIYPIIEMMKDEPLPNIHKLALIKTLIRFTEFHIEHDMRLSLKTSQLTSILGLIENLAKKQIINESIDYLFILGQVGLKLINTGQKLLILDPASDFLFAITSSTEQIVELIKWKHDNPQKDFIIAYEEVIFKTRVKLRKRVSLDESDLQPQAKKHKGDDHS